MILAMNARRHYPMPFLLAVPLSIGVGLGCTGSGTMGSETDDATTGETSGPSEACSVITSSCEQDVPPTIYSMIVDYSACE